MSNQVVPRTLAEFPERPTKSELLDSVLQGLEDLGRVFDVIHKGPESLVIDEATGILLAQTCTRLTTIKAVLGAIAYLEHKRQSALPRLVLP